MAEERYPRKCYQQLKAHAEMGRTNWASAVRNLLFTLGFGQVWTAQEQLSDVKLFLYDVKQRLMDIDMQNLNSRIKVAFLNIFQRVQLRHTWKIVMLQ